MFKEDRDIPGAAKVNENVVVFNAETPKEVEYAVSVIVDTIRTTVYYETSEMIEEFE
jgi:hypothetical protein